MAPSDFQKYRTLQRLVVLLTIGALLCFTPHANAKGIHVTVEASWNETSFLQEGCEWAGRSFGAKAFYSCVDALWTFTLSKPDEAAPESGNSDGAASTATVSARYSTQQAQYAAVRAVVRTLPETQMADAALFEVEMAARVYSPAVEAHYSTAAQALQDVAAQYGGTASPCACGEPFGVLYTRVQSAGGQLEAHFVCTAAALNELQAKLQRPHDSAHQASSAFLTPVQNVSLPRLDYRFPSPAPAADVTAVLVLYGLLGSPETRKLHDGAVAWVTQGERATQGPTSTTLAYFFRHLPVSPARLCGSAALHEHWDAPLAVQGYGVTVDIKNMEYKVLDEKAAAQQKAKEAAEASTGAVATEAPSGLADQADHVVGGFHVQRLKERYPHLSHQLNELAALMEDEVGSGDLKVDFDVWELQNIGLAAAQYIREVKNSSRRLHVLQDLVNRFPVYAAALSRIAAQPARFELVQQTLAGVRQRLQPGTSALFVDGWRVEEKDLSLFGALEALKADEVLSHHVKRALTTRLLPRSEDAMTATTAAAPYEPRDGTTAKVHPALLEKVSSYVKRAARDVGGASAASASEAAFAIPADFVTWLNNVETEARFDGMSKKLSTFFTQAPDVTPFPRRNLLNYVFIWNPLLKSNLQMMTLIYRLNHQGLLARYGLLLLDPAWSADITPDETGVGAATMPGAADGTSGLSHDVLALSAIAYHVAEAGVPEKLLEVLVQLLQGASATAVKSDTIPSDRIQQVCRHTAQSLFGVGLDELLNDAAFVTHYHETQAMLRRFPMADYPATLLNGVVLDSQGGQLNTALQYEVMRLRAWVSDGALEDSTEDFYTAILQLRGAADHLQPALLHPPRTVRWTATRSLVAFIEDAPYLYSAIYAMDVPSLTQVLALPCRCTTQTLRQLQTVLAALQSCAELSTQQAGKAVATDAPHAAVCRSLRVSVAPCPTAPAVHVGGGADREEADSASPSATSSSLSAADYVAALLRQMAQRDVAETKRFRVLQRYIDHLLTAVDASPSVSAAYRRAGQFDRATVAAALAAHPLPADLHLADGFVESHQRYVRSAGQSDFWATLASSGPLHESGVTLVTNGRIIAMDDTFTAWDVLEAAHQALPLTKIVEEAVLKVNFAEMTAVDGDGAFTSDELDNTFYSAKIACLASAFAHEEAAHDAVRSTSLLAREESLFASAEDRKRLRAVLFTVNNTQNSSRSSQAAGAAGEGVHQITAVVDPSSRDAQLIVSLVAHLMRTPLQLRLTVLLNPSLDVKFPIRDFYEYVASGTVHFDPASGRVVPPAATFTQLPASALLTLGVEEPPTWTVFSQAAEEDLDNILLSKLSPGTLYVFAVYRMHSVLVTGETVDGQSGELPVGLPLSLTPALRTTHDGIPAYTRSTDTQVMANQNGYYQLQATPGLWYLSVKPGPVATAYCLEAIGTQIIAACAEGRAAVNFTQGQRLPIVVDSFSGRYLPLRVRHTPTPNSAPPEQLRDILQRMAADVTHTWPPPWRLRGAKPQPPARPTLHVFSVASGHLYERFLRMMFYSVHRTSSDKYGANSTRIKFWVIENFLSPQFKRYIPLLAAELGFEVGFVTYRWPWWLPRQTEKQRKIWAYKILFLDVLFPLDVDRVIFVDADQTAQADLHELYNMDIGRSPVAMTPFCQTYRNEDTVRFRFWEHGFWVDHLKGKPYHISAIFLVDLRRFRAMLAGDRYRATYANLASDPNSLANLDQDLPNYLQANIPIFSLPEQWLWCETWCSAKSKAKAKTIDLCNNPLTKMPKLDNAKMVIPGWEEIDNKLQNMSDTLLGLH